MMTSFNSDMQNEKLAAILLVIVIVGSIFVFLTATYSENIVNFITGKKTGEKVIAIGDCVDVNFIGRFASNNTIFASSYNDATKKTGGTPLKIFVSTNTSESSPTGYENYTNLINDYYVKGFIEGLIGLKEGDSKTIGPIENAYGVYPKIGDVITVFDPSVGKEIGIHFVNITNNGTTTLFVLRFDVYSLGEKTTIYPSWENATVVTKINDTKVWKYTTPPEDKIENFTWVSVSSDGYTGIVYPDNASSASINDTTIVVTHNPQIGATMAALDYYSQTTTYLTVVNLTDEKINVSYTDANTGATSYAEFNRTVTIVRNESQDITDTYTTPDMENFLSGIKSYYDPNLTFSLNKLADESIVYELQIVKIYKTS